jgi:hypothetical protein
MVFIDPLILECSLIVTAIELKWQTFRIFVSGIALNRVVLFAQDWGKYSSIQF